jgi:hypothetical protein
VEKNQHIGILIAKIYQIKIIHENKNVYRLILYLFPLKNFCLYDRCFMFQRKTRLYKTISTAKNILSESIEPLQGTV